MTRTNTLVFGLFLHQGVPVTECAGVTRMPCTRKVTLRVCGGRRLGETDMLPPVCVEEAAQVFVTLLYEV